MTERIVGNPASLEHYTQQTRETVRLTRESIENYSTSLNAFLRAQPNDFGDGGVKDHRANLDAMLDALAKLDAEPGAFAFALRELDQHPWGPQPDSSRHSTEDVCTFEALVATRLNPVWQDKSDAEVRSYVKYQAGSSMATQIKNDLSEDGTSGEWKVDPALIEELRKSAADPDFVRGFYDTLGPGGLADLSGQLLYSSYYDDHPNERTMTFDALSRALGVYSRAVATLPPPTPAAGPTIGLRAPELNDFWLDQFAAPNGLGALQYRLDLLAPLLMSGDFDKDFLNAVGSRMLYPKPTDNNENGWGSYDPWTLVYAAIAKDPQAASEFLKAHRLRIQEISTGYETGPIPDFLGKRHKAFADLVRSATVDLRDSDPQAAAMNTKLLIESVANNEGEHHVFGEMQATYGLIVQEYFSDMAYSFTSLAPEGLADREYLERDNLSDVNTVQKGLVPAAMWTRLLDEALRDGPTAVTLAGVVDKWAEEVLAANRKMRWNDPVDGGAASQLSTHGIVVMENLFIAETQQTIRTLEGDVARWRQGVKSIVSGVLPALINDPKTLSQWFAKLFIDPLVDKWTPEALASDLGELKGVELKEDWRSTYRKEAAAQWKDNGAKIPPVWVETKLPGTELERIEEGKPVYGFTGDPKNYIRDENSNFLDKEQRPVDPGSMSPEQRQAYERWLQDPALVQVTWGFVGEVLEK